MKTITALQYLALPEAEKLAVLRLPVNQIRIDAIRRNGRRPIMCSMCDSDLLDCGARAFCECPSLGLLQPNEIN